jgi:hypothetical protein
VRIKQNSSYTSGIAPPTLKVNVMPGTVNWCSRQPGPAKLYGCAARHDEVCPALEGSRTCTIRRACFRPGSRPRRKALNSSAYGPSQRLPCRRRDRGHAGR